MSFDYAEWLADHAASDQSCLSESEAEAAEAEQAEQERLKNLCVRALLMLGLVPRNYMNQRFWRKS